MTAPFSQSFALRRRWLFRDGGRITASEDSANTQTHAPFSLTHLDRFGCPLPAFTTLCAVTGGRTAFHSLKIENPHYLRASAVPFEDGKSEDFRGDLNFRAFSEEYLYGAMVTRTATCDHFKRRVGCLLNMSKTWNWLKKEFREIL